MFAKITSIKLCELEGIPYWQITLADENGNMIGIFGSKIKDAISFRKETFGILQICDTMDLLKIVGHDFTIDFMPSAIALTNIASCKDQEPRYYFLQKYVGEEFKTETGTNCDNILLVSAQLVSVESKSGTICLTYVDNDGYTCGSSVYGIYTGFKEIYGDEVSKEKERESAELFRKFILQLLKICKIDDLITDKSPNVMVQVEIDEENKIVGLGNFDGSYWMKIVDNEIVLDALPTNSKIKK